MKVHLKTLTNLASRGSKSSQIPTFYIGDPGDLGPEIEMTPDELMVYKDGNYLAYTPDYNGFLHFSEKGWDKHRELFKAAYIENVVKPYPENTAKARADYAQHGLDFDAYQRKWGLDPEASPTWEAYEAEMNDLFKAVKAGIPKQIKSFQKKIDKLQAQIDAMKALM